MVYVMVKEYESDAEYVRIPLEDNRLNILTLKAVFPSFNYLFFREDGVLTTAGICQSADRMELLFTEPESGWSGKVFFVCRNPRSSNSAKRFGGSNSKEPSLNSAPETQPSISKERLSKVRKWVYISYQGGDGRNVQVCVSVISLKYAASAAHCFPNALEGEKFSIINVDDENEQQNWKEVQVVYVDRYDDNGKGADIIIFGAPSGENLFTTAPVFQHPNSGSKYVAIGKGPNRQGDDDAICYTHGMITSSDSGRDIMSDSGNPDYSGGIVLSRKDHGLFGLIVSRNYVQPCLGWIDIIGDKNQPRSFVVSSCYMKSLPRQIDERETLKQLRIRYEECLKHDKDKKEHDSC